MKPIRIFRHVDCEGPGYLLDVLARFAVPYELVRIDQGDEVPLQISDISGLVFMGGNMSVNDDLPWIQQELDIIRRAKNAGMPMLGHCLGGQLISKALGGSVVPNKVKELGWHSVSKHQSVVTDSWLKGLNDDMLMFHWHGETFSLPAGAELILENKNCDHQAFALDNTLAFQCHIEMTEELVREWVSRFSDQLTGEVNSVQTPELVLQDLKSRVKELNQFADVIYQRWLQPIISHA